MLSSSNSTMDLLTQIGEGGKARLNPSFSQTQFDFPSLMHKNVPKQSIHKILVHMRLKDN